MELSPPKKKRRIPPEITEYRGIYTHCNKLLRIYQTNHLNLALNTVGVANIDVI